MFRVRYTRNLFLRGICIIYLCAFLSFYIQIPGLYGDNGILPARTQLNFDHGSIYKQFLKKPTLVWFAPYLGLNVEYMLDVLSLLGATLAFLGFISQKFCIIPTFVALWSLYFSLYQVGQIFMKFQWDLLLLETGFLCIFIAPLLYSQHSKKSTPSDTVTFWIIRWLLFRLIFSTGAGKLISQCPAWWSLKALNTYFESQCIPTALAWYAHHLPTWFLRLTTVVTNIIEIVIPFLFLFPNRLVRISAFYLQVFLQISIIVTGNYNFYNLLIICLCISLLDDHIFNGSKHRNNTNVINRKSVLLCILVYGIILYGMYFYYNIRILNNWTIHSEIAFNEKQFSQILSYMIPISIYIGITSLGFIIVNTVKDLVTLPKVNQSKGITSIVTIFYTAAVCLMFTLSIVPYAKLHPSYNVTIPSYIQKLHKNVEHLHLVNNYGSYSPMKSINGRFEVIIEGGNTIDGPWKEYEFLYKPGNVNNLLPFVAPHQPRLDWQMCFASTSTYHKNPWLMSLTYRLLSGQPEVLALINTVESPFNEKPPKYIKASLYQYHYTTWNTTGSNTQPWWTRKRVDEYMSIFTRDHLPLIEYLSKQKIIQDKASLIITNKKVKSILDTIRGLISNIEASLFLWGVHTAGCGIMLL